MGIEFGKRSLITNAAMTSSFMSDPIDLVQRIGFSIHNVFTGSPNGSFYIAVSIDNIQWILLPDSSQAISAAGDVFYNVSDSKYVAARLHYAFTSGSGTLNSTYSTKEAI